MHVPATTPTEGGTDEPLVQVSVLGHVRATRAGAEVDLGPPKHRALLAALAMAEGLPLDADALVPLLWPADQEPADPVSGLHVYVSGLRRVLEGPRRPRARPQVLVTSGGGYALESTRVGIDAAEVAHVATRSRRLLRTAEGQVVPAPGIPAATLEEILREIDLALARWRGTPYLDLVSTVKVEAARAHLTGAQLSLLEDRAVAQLALGRHAETAHQLGALLVERTLDERLWSLYVLALVRSDRQADALEALRTARHHLAEELGVDPGQALRDLEGMVLRQDPSLYAAPARAATGPRLPTAVDPPTYPPGGPQAAGRAPQIVGRDHELGLLREQLAASGTRVVQIVGEAGIGKSTLTAQAAREAREAGELVCVARCPEDEGAPPLWPWLDLLSTMAEQLEDPELAGPLLAAADAASGGDPGTGLAGDAELARFRMFEAVERALTAVASERRCTILLEDLHWADPSTARLVAHLAGAWALARNERNLLLVLTRRPGEDAVGHPGMGAALDALARHGTTRIDLTGLRADDVGRLARRLSSWEVNAVTVAELHARTAGNPFLLGELLRLGEAALRAGEIPAGVADVVQRRLATMPADTRTTLVTASVVGHEFDLDVVAAASALVDATSRPGDGVDLVLDALDPAVAAGLVVDNGGDRMAFVHALTRDAVYASLGPTRRARLHARVAEALDRRGPGSPSTSEVARHWVLAGPQHVGRAWRSLQDAGLAPTRRFAIDEAAELLDDAMTAQNQDVGATSEDRVVLAEAAIAALLQAGRWERFLARVEEAAARAEADGDVELVARFAVMPAEAGPWTPRPYGTVDQAAIRRLRRVLDALPSTDGEQRCRVMLALGSELYFSPGSAQERRALVDEGLAMARRLGDPALLGRISERAALVTWRGGNAEERLRLATEAVEAAALAGETGLLQTAVALRMSAALEVGHIDVMLADVARARDLLEDRPSIYHTVVLACLVVPWLAAQGRFNEAGARLEEAARVGAGSQLPWAVLALGTAHVGLAAFRPAEEDRDLDLVIGQIAPVLPSVRLLLSLRTGDVAAVRAFLETSAPSLRTDDFTSLFHHALAAEAAYVVGDPKLAADAYAGLAGDAGHVASAGTGIALGPVDAYLALAAAATGDRTRAARHADDAAGLMQSWGLAACEAWLQGRRAEGGW